MPPKLFAELEANFQVKVPPSHAKFFYSSPSWQLCFDRLQLELPAEAGVSQGNL